MNLNVLPFDMFGLTFSLFICCYHILLLFVIYGFTWIFSNFLNSMESSICRYKNYVFRYEKYIDYFFHSEKFKFLIV
jgi:hypothetical protein